MTKKPILVITIYDDHSVKTEYPDGTQKPTIVSAVDDPIGGEGGGNNPPPPKDP